MANFNKTFLIGNLTREPELKYTPNGTAVCELGLAINHKYNSKDEKRNDVCFIDVIVWSKQGESCAKYLSKGSQVMIEGRLTMERWIDKKTGDNRVRIKVIAEQVQFLDRKEKQEFQERPKYSVSDRPAIKTNNQSIPF